MFRPNVTPRVSLRGNCGDTQWMRGNRGKTPDSVDKENLGSIDHFDLELAPDLQNNKG